MRPYGASADCGAFEQKALAKPSRHLVAAKASEYDAGQRARPAFRIRDMRSLRLRRERKGTFDWTQQGFTDRSIEGCGALFAYAHKIRGLDQQTPIPALFTA